MSDQIVNQKHVVLPPVKVDMGGNYVFSWHAYMMLVCEIPAGKVASVEEIMKCLTDAYGVELPLEHTSADVDMRLREFYPYWRAVSERGHIHKSNKSTGDLNKLRAEGVEILEPNPEVDSLVVIDFKDKKFSFTELKVSVLETDKEIWKKLLQHQNGNAVTIQAQLL